MLATTRVDLSYPSASITMAPMPSIFDTVRDLERLRQIVIVLGRHGFGEIVQRTGLGALVTKVSGAPPSLSDAQPSAGAPGGTPSMPPKVSFGERLRLVTQELGPSFVKLGQIISTRPDVIPPDIIEELKKLQDRVPPVPFEALRPQIEEELGGTIPDLFVWFDETPLASASVAQVHRARLKDSTGTEQEVVLKVQRPGIKDTVERDIDLLYWLARAVERSIPESKIYAPTRLVAEFERAIKAELDFLQEADHAEKFADNFSGHTEVKFPKIYRQFSSRRVLTMEFLDGKKVYDAVQNGYSGETIAKRSIGIIMKQIYEDGLFHADPHPGNLFIMGTPEDPVLGMIDLGLVGRLTPQLRDKTVDLMVAAVRNDYKGLADALYAIGRPTKKIDRDAYDAEVAVLAEKYLGKKLADIEISALIRDLVYGATKYGIEIPPDFLMVGKALMTIEGIGKEIHPELDVYSEVRPYFMKLFWQRYSPEKISQDLLRTALRAGNAASDLPMQIQEILEDLRKNRLNINISEQNIGDAADRVGRRMYSGFVVASLVLSSSILLASDKWVLGVLALLASLGWGGAHILLLAWLSRKSKHKEM